MYNFIYIYIYIYIYISVTWVERSARSSWVKMALPLPSSRILSISSADASGFTTCTRAEHAAVSGPGRQCDTRAGLTLSGATYQRYRTQDPVDLHGRRVRLHHLPPTHSPPATNPFTAKNQPTNPVTTQSNTCK